MGLSSGMPGMELFPSGNSHTLPLMLVPVEEFLLEFAITEVRARKRTSLHARITPHVMQNVKP